MCLEAVEAGFGGDVDFAQLHKLYATPNEGDARRYSPPICIGCDAKVVVGDPDPDHVSTTYVERANLSIWMGMRRFTRLTNGFSKKVAKLYAAFAIWIVHYNFVRRHQTLRITPAMAAKVTDRLWSIDDLVAILIDREAAARAN